MVRPSSKQGRINKVSMVKQEPHLSGAYIRNLVKHLTSIKTKDSFNGECFSDHNNMQQHSPPPLPPPPPPPPHKKQVRRRHHTTKPYQERFLNMADARREIVTALKFHRASIKPAQTTTTTAAADLTTTSPPPPPPPYHYQNLNFQDFKNLDASFYHKPLSNYPMSSSSSTVNSTTTTTSGGSSDLHHAMDDDEMEKIRSLVEQHQMEWNDTVNILMSARWFKFLKSIEIEAEDEKDDLGFNLFDQVMEFPPW